MGHTTHSCDLQALPCGAFQLRHHVFTLLLLILLLLLFVQDLKLENMLLVKETTPEGGNKLVAKLADFGLHVVRCPLGGCDGHCPMGFWAGAPQAQLQSMHGWGFREAIGLGHC